jgi:hypothetical protein
MLYTTKLSTQG